MKHRQILDLRDNSSAWGPHRIHRRTPLLEHTTLKRMGASPLPSLDSLRIQGCFAVGGVMEPPSYSKNLTFTVLLPESQPPQARI